MIFFVVVGTMVLVGVVWGLLTRNRPTYRTDRLRDLDPRLKRQIDGQFMRGDGGHHREDWE
jgi:hypothetical protein